jgi:hypothetical protein
VRLRLLIAAAIAAAIATYIALVREEAPAAPPWIEPPFQPPHSGPRAPVLTAAPTVPAPDPVPPPPEAAAPAAAPAMEPEAQQHPEPAPVPPPPPAPVPEPPPAAEPVRQAADPSVLEEGRFSLGGWAAAPGHSVVAGVTFRRRLPYAVAAAAVELMVEAADNVAAHGLVVLADPGFAPDREGFTLLLAAASEGPFSAAGTYLVRSEPRV